MTLIGIGGGLPYTPAYNWSDAEVTGLLQAQFARNPASFDINRWSKLVPTKMMSGLFQVLDPTNGSRVVNATDYVWPQGNDIPRGEQDWYTQSQFVCQRFAPTFTIPIATADQLAALGVDTVAGHAATHAQKAMTIRTMNAVTAATTSGNWGGNYAATATAAGGGSWVASTADNAYIQKTIQAVMQAVELSTGGAVRGNELIMVCGPSTARTIAQAPEFKDFVKQQVSSPAIQMGDPSVVIPAYGIPRTLFGLRDIVVDRTVRTTSQRGASSTASSYVLGNGVFFVTQRADVEGITGGWDWSTIQNFAYQNLEVGTEYQQFEERVRGKVVDTIASMVAVPQSGYYIASIAS